MNIKITKLQLIHMIMGGNNPNLSQMNNLTARAIGWWQGGLSEKWHWQTKGLELLSKQKLLDLYKELNPV